MLGEKTGSKNYILYDSLYESYNDTLEKTELLRQKKYISDP